MRSSTKQFLNLVVFRSAAQIEAQTNCKLITASASQNLEGFMKLYISVVSHRHQDVIINLESLKKLAKVKNISIVCLDNIATPKLRKYCREYKIHYLTNREAQGFAANNNRVFNHCVKKLGMGKNDAFMLLNPDVMIDKKCLELLLASLEEHPNKIHAPNLFIDKEHIVQDDNIRKYPKFWNFVRTYLLNDRSTMIERDKEQLPNGDKVWASGAAMMLRAEVYANLCGLDETYFLYCEDIDFCMRAKVEGHFVHYSEQAKAIHFRQRESKRFLTCYFFWHVQSVFLYTFAQYKLRKPKSCTEKFFDGDE
ncbi:rhamnosyl transferase [Vibrio parahaemolyticus]|uniref:Rhamnosyltransferase WbbL n=2 Tax=Vibrio parahaemolyticus TaxID=670 RepID=A0A7M1WAX4_VIBPH|nr:rhamnosyltransferase WbbL [Vibrio parahaemolyticus]QOS18801.1 rhamnosyltransferase WbbL [Vibrio parahaemolyticus]QOS24215.1 rhamnosyltransferase WbbL [Vibrio parahaemolyticus]QOS27517.1 rhamnosyltransferase WbbL [Vibrio parahaemolyticus]QOS29710.1 rhamnosyltransferase WbbL [Vibrio parahaemolyticus]